MGLITKDQDVLRKVVEKGVIGGWTFYNFPCRRKGKFMEFLNGPLAHWIKASDGINLIIKEFDSIGQLLDHWINIHDASPHIVLSRAFHLLHSFVAILN